jgi:hypothetical protein
MLFFGHLRATSGPLARAKYLGTTNSKGHFFWAMYASENYGKLEAQWIKGRLTLSEVKRARW